MKTPQPEQEPTQKRPDEVVIDGRGNLFSGNTFVDAYINGMTSDEYGAFHKAVCDEARELSLRKNEDYSDPEGKPNDPYRLFHNFLQVERMGICRTETGFLTRLSDKFTRLAIIIQRGTTSVIEETEADTIHDIINYLILMLAYRTVKQDRRRHEEDRSAP